MEQYLITIEYRFKGKPNRWDSTDYETKQTLGVFDTLEDAMKCGNEFLPLLEARWDLNPNYNKKERFHKNMGMFIISDLAYIKTPFTFYAKIEKLRYFDSEILLDEITKSCYDYKQYKKLQEN